MCSVFTSLCPKPLKQIIFRWQWLPTLNIENRNYTNSIVSNSIEAQIKMSHMMNTGRLKSHLWNLTALPVIHFIFIKKTFNIFSRGSYLLKEDLHHCILLFWIHAYKLSCWTLHRRVKIKDSTYTRTSFKPSTQYKKHDIPCNFVLIQLLFCP